jgi:hypothetical protein
VKWPFKRLPAATPEADEASAQARRALLDARNFDQRAQRVAARSLQIGLRNHIGESLEIAIIPKGAM